MLIMYDTDKNASIMANDNDNQSILIDDESDNNNDNNNGKYNDNLLANDMKIIGQRIRCSTRIKRKDIFFIKTEVLGLVLKKTRTHKIRKKQAFRYSINLYRVV